MRLVSFEDTRGERLGAIDDTGNLRDVSAVPGVPATMGAALANWVQAMTAIEQALRGDAPVLDNAAVTMLPPVPHPGSLLCIGYNYFGHGDDAGSVPEYPDVFLKATSCLIGPGAAIELPPQSANVDYEGELAVVIGAPARHVSVDDALDYVAGYTIVNDVSARDLQERGSQWSLGKSCDTFGPMGPWLTTADAVPDPQALDITVECHGEVTVQSSTSLMMRSVADLISYLSELMTLRPGDVIATGTPGKLPAAGASGRSLSPSDVVSVTYGHLGTLTSPVTSAAPKSTPEPNGR